MIDFVRYYSDLSGIPGEYFIPWIGIGRSKFYDWKSRYGRVNEHNALVPRDHWLEEWEKEAIVIFYLEHRTDGYRRITFMMLDLNIVAVSPSTTYRVLISVGLLRRWNVSPSKKGTGFQQPLEPHEHWHVDICYINICGTFYYQCSLLDGYSRYIVHWEIRESMTECDIETIIERARERFPEVHPRIISDNGPQFIAREFKEYIRLCGMTHVKTSPYYPQSNGKLERFHKSLKAECIRPKTPLSLEEARRIVGGFVDDYNNKRLHSAIGYIVPKDKLEGREEIIFAERDRKLEEARERRSARRREVRENKGILTLHEESDIILSTGETEAGSAEEQPVRDNRLEVRRNVEKGMENKFCPLPYIDISENFPMPEKTQHIPLRDTS